MNQLESIALNLLSGGIGLLIPTFLNAIAKEPIIKDEPSNKFYGWLCLCAVPLVMCQYVDTQWYKIILTLIAGVAFSMCILSYKVVCIRQEDKTKRKTTNKGKKRKNRHK